MMTEEEQLDGSQASSKKKPPVTPIEVVANKEFISWKYPPYCELCNVYFSGEPCSETHFKGVNHRNRLQIWKKYNDPESMLPSDEQLENTTATAAASTSKNVVCDVCWKETNTQKILDDHCASPVHKSEIKKRTVVQKLKEEYRQLKASNNT